MTFSSAKFVSLFASVLALSTMGSQIALAQQPPRPNTTPPGNTQPSNQPPSIKDFLGLTDAQLTKIQEILVNRQQKIEQVLNQKQLQILEEARSSRQAPDPEKLNLTADQKTRIASIYQASSDAIRNVLTPEQLKKLEAQIQQQNQQNQPNQPNQPNPNRQ